MTQDIVCITKDDYYIGTLTFGKTYQAYYNEKEPVYSSTGLYYTITNDIGVKAEYHESHFISKQKWRESQLNKIIS